MVDKYTKDKKYDYDVNANKVVNNEYDQPSRNMNEPSGEPESLLTYTMHKFGDLAQKEKAPKMKGKPLQQKEGSRVKSLTQPMRQQEKAFDSTEALIYKPKTKETLAVYEEFLSLIRVYLMDQPSNFLKSALDVIIAALKQDANDYQKKADIEAILGPITNEELNKMYQLTKGLVDYDAASSSLKANESIEMNIDFDEGDRDEGAEEDDMAYNNSDQSMDEGQNEPEQEQNIKGDQELFEDVKKEDFSKVKDTTMLSIGSVIGNPYWLQVYLREKLKVDDSLVLSNEKDIIAILKNSDLRECENKLVLMLSRENFDFIKFLLKNKPLVYYMTILGKCQNDLERKEAIEEMCSTKEGYDVYSLIEASKDKTKAKTKQKPIESISQSMKTSEAQIDQVLKTTLNLEALTFSSHHIHNKKIVLPKGTFKSTKPGYEEIYIPPTPSDSAKKDKSIQIESLPKWMHKAFQIKDEEKGTYEFISPEFNKVQSKVLHTALYTDENLLICAPTSSGKTNIALMTILRLMSTYMNESTCLFQLKNFKIVYIAPMKALVKETVGNFSQRLREYGMIVKELSGDFNLTKAEIDSTHVIVTTPEKWDIITRKSGERSIGEKVQLIIVDEIHLLHDTRGAVLESIIARTIRKIESTKEKIRIVALSATLPNYKDVALFCHVDIKKGLFYFDGAYRPIPLEQRFIGLTEKKGIKKLLLINEITYEKVIERIGKKQMIIFVHSRRETLRTAKALIELANNKGNINVFSLGETKSNEFNEVLNSDVSNEVMKDKSLLEIFKYGIGIHHAGMERSDREIVEEYFNNGYLNIIVSTATLAWGVNLPAHTVIIKGTQVYDPEKGQWVELSHLDVMQMMGRAGRVGYGTPLGEGIIITSFNELQFYLSLLNQQLPIESQMINALPDNLNAEIVSGSISNIKEGVNWLSYTYLFIRMLKSPELYGISNIDTDNMLIKRRTDLIHSAATILDKQGLIKYNSKSGELMTTQLGKVSSYYYIKHQSMGIYNQNLQSTNNIIDLFRIFSLSIEFKLIPIREEEKKEIEKLLSKIPIPVKGSPDESSTKINILLQAYISQFPLDGYAISSDMIYVSQSAGRIFRALYEISVKRSWAAVAITTLNICKMIQHRTWNTMSPLRQFGIIPEDILHKIESKEQLTWDRFYDLTPTQISELIKINKKNSEGIHKLIHTFPRFELSANIQPMTRNSILVELLITPNFKLNLNYHKKSELFHIFVEDNDSEILLHYETFTMKERSINNKEEKRITFIVPMIEPMPPQYFVRVISENWLNCEKMLAIYFKHLILPEKFPMHTNLLDFQPLPFNVLNNPSIEQIYSIFPSMNSIQTQCFKFVYESDKSVFIGATCGNGKTALAEMAIIKHFLTHSQHSLKAPVVYICGNQASVEEKFAAFTEKFDYAISKLTGEFTIDNALFDSSQVLITSPKCFDMLTRKWKKKKAMNEIKLIIVDDIHLLNEEESTLEVVLSRVRFLSSEAIRFVVLSTSLANPNSICEWLGIDNDYCFNFNPNVRPNKIEIFFYGYDSISHKTRLSLMTKPILQLISKHCFVNKYQLSTMVYASDQRAAKSFCIDLLSSLASEGNMKKCLISSMDNYKDIISFFEDEVLKECLMHGIGYIDQSLLPNEREIIISLYKERIIQILVITHSLVWEVNCCCHVVIIADPVSYDGKEGKWIDYSISDMFQIMGRASIIYLEKSQGIPSAVRNCLRKCLIFFQNSKKEFYKKFLLESFPIESHLNLYLHNNLNAEISNGTIRNKQNCIDWLTWTFMYRRLLQNPNYYDLKGKSNDCLNEYLSELIDNTLNDLIQAQCININSITGEIEPLNLGKIASYYYIIYNTIDLFNQSFNESSNKLSEMLQILKNSYEFEEIALHKNEAFTLLELASELPQSYLGEDIRKAIRDPETEESAIAMNNPHNKALILLLSYISRKEIPSEMHQDLERVVIISERLVLAMVDVLSSKQYLKPSLLAMELSQMIIQALWITESPLMQLPYFSKDTIEKCKAKGIEDIADLMNMEDKERNSLLQLEEQGIAEIAKVCNRYPNIDMAITFKTQQNEYHSKENVTLMVELKRDYEDIILTPVHSGYYPHSKEETWWIIIGDPSNNKLKAIKRLSFVKELTVLISFEAPDPIGEYNYKLYLFCDSWIGSDQDDTIQFKVVSS